MDSVMEYQTGISIALASALIDALWQGAVLAAAAALSLQAPASAALRHNVGMAFLMAMLAWPAWTFASVIGSHANAASEFAPHAWTTPLAAWTPDILTPPSGGWAAALCAVWLAGVAWTTLRHIGGLWWVSKLESRRFRGLPPAMQARMDAMKRRMGIAREVVVRVVDDAVMPFTARLFRPAIWIPQELLSHMPWERLEALLAHELAHIRRLDWVWNGVQCVVESLLFFHPGVWWLSRRIRADREHACDDLAMAAGADPVVFAEALSDLARAPRPVSRLLLAANGGPLTRRIVRILPGAPAPARSFAPVALGCLLAACVVFATQIEPAAAPALRLSPSAALETAHARRDAELAALDRLDAQRDAELAALDRAQAERDAAQARRDAEYAKRDAWLAKQDAERAARDRADDKKWRLRGHTRNMSKPSN